MPKRKHTESPTVSPRGVGSKQPHSSDGPSLNSDATKTKQRKQKSTDDAKQKQDIKPSTLTVVTDKSSSNGSEKPQHSKKKLYSREQRAAYKKLQSSKDSSPAVSRQPAAISGNWKAMLQTMNGGNKVVLKPKLVTPVAKSVSKEKVEKPADDIWFDDVDDAYLDRKDEAMKTTDVLVKSDSFKGVTKAVAMDCEMVGVGAESTDSVLARVSIVNQYGHCLLDTFVKPKEPVTDYRTAVSGVRPCDLETGETLESVQKKVHGIVVGRILVGHAIFNDLQVLFLDHPRKMIRDTQRFKPFRAMFGGRNPSLKKLSEKVLKVTVQKGEHSSVEDAQATMRLYTMYKQQWEKELSAKSKQGPRKRPAKSNAPRINKSSLDD